MRIVPDANIIISGLLWRGSPRRLIGMAHSREIELYGSDETYAEFCRIVQYDRFKKHLKREIFSTEKLLVDYRAFVRPVSVGNVLEGQIIVAADPTDDAYFRVAKACGAKLIITRDAHLLNIAKFDDVRVVEPHIFLEIFPQLRGSKVS